MSDGGPRQLDGLSTPGSLLRAERKAQGMSEREAADRLHLLPGYVAIIERDDYVALRSPAFARGYVRSYGRLLGLQEEPLLQLFDDHFGHHLTARPRRPARRPLQLQRTGTAVLVGLAVLALLVAALWWRGANAPSAYARGTAAAAAVPLESPPGGGGEG